MDSCDTADSSDENETTTSEDTTSLCLQSSAENVAEGGEDSAKQASTVLTRVTGCEATDLAGITDISEDVSRDELKKSTVMSEIAIGLDEDEDCPSGESECSKDCGSNEEAQERAYQALL